MCPSLAVCALIVLVGRSAIGVEFGEAFCSGRHNTHTHTQHHNTITATVTTQHHHRRSAHEAALRKWLEALEAANAQLRGLGREGHVSVLRQQVLLEVLKRVDALLFHYLGAWHEIETVCVKTERRDGGVVMRQLSAAGEHKTTRTLGPSKTSPHTTSTLQHHNNTHPHPPVDPDPSQPGAEDAASGIVTDARSPNTPCLDDSMLFFARGRLTFGTGMQLKMACARLQQWAFGDGGLRDIWARLPEQGQALFPLLKVCGAVRCVMMAAAAVMR